MIEYLSSSLFLFLKFVPIVLVLVGAYFVVTNLAFIFHGEVVNTAFYETRNFAKHLIKVLVGVFIVISLLYPVVA